MKKTLTAFLLVAMVIALNSCKSREKCPAYGSHTTPGTHQPS